MSGVAETCARWLAAGRPFALATLVDSQGSSPRPVGTSMVIGEGGEVHGSLSGGCVEADVVETGREVLSAGIPQRRRYGYTDSAAWEVGLTCGGSIDVLVQPVRDADAAQRLAPVLEDLPGAVLWRLDAPERRISLPVPAADDPAAWSAALPALLADGQDGPCPTDGSAVRRLAELLADRSAAAATGIVGPGEDCTESLPELFLAVRRPAPRLIVAGTTDLAAALVAQGRMLGYATTVCDPRSAFLTPERFPAAERIVVRWPHRYLLEEHAAGRLDHRTVVCCLGHDPKVDDPLVETALALPIAYVGAMGSRRTHRERMQRLAARGASPSDLARLHSPIGLDLGGSAPAEFALSVMAEVVAERHGRPGAAPLRATVGPLHGLVPA